MSPSFLIEFAKGSKSVHALLMRKAFDRTSRHLFGLPRVITREGRAEPGLPGPFRPTSTPEAASSKIAVLKLVVQVATEDDGKGKTLETDESYTLSVVAVNSTAAVATLEANNVYGALYGLTTFTQLFRIYGLCAITTNVFIQ